MPRAPAPPPWPQRTPLDRRAARRRRGLIALELAPVAGGMALVFSIRLPLLAVGVGIIAIFLFAAAIAAAFSER